MVLVLATPYPVTPTVEISPELSKVPRLPELKIP